MRLVFWGTRGSIAAPGANTAGFGGNTTCLEVDTGSGERAALNDHIILDAGTGIRALGLALAKSRPVRCAVFITHTHWDHIQGLPFFVPLFVPGSRVAIHGPFDPVGLKDIRGVLEGQMAYPYFPVSSAELKADISYQTLSEGQSVRVGEATVSAILMNHPVISLGYKVQCGGKALFFTGDHEDYANIYKPDDPLHEEYQGLIEERRQALADFLRGVDVLVADAMYTDAELPAKTGWGHSCPAACARLARLAGIPRLILTHFDPTRDDEALLRFEQDARAAHQGPDLAIELAREGLAVEI
ncbi:MBL fold metallo-hydrolase [Humidesulfovibrio sp.]